MDTREPPPEESSNTEVSLGTNDLFDTKQPSDAAEEPSDPTENSPAESKRPFQYSLSTLFLITTLAAFAATVVRWRIGFGEMFVAQLVTAVIVLGMTGIIVMGTVSIVNNFGRVSELRWLKMIQRFYVAVLVGGTIFFLLAALLTWLLHVCFPR